MNIKKIAGVAAGVALALGLAAPASAITLTAGDLTITFNAFDSGTVGYGNAVGNVCATVAGCNAAGALPAPNSYFGEDTWGIFSVQSITRLSDGSPVYTLGQGGKYLTGMFGGIMDSEVNVSTDFLGRLNTTAYGTGGWLNMYETTQNYNSSFGPAGRTANQSYNGITNVPGGVLALSAVFGNGVAFGDSYSYVSNYLNQTISGSSSGYLDVTGGTMASDFNTDSQFDPNGGSHDMFLSSQYRVNPVASNAGWTVAATGSVDAAVPEPASLALFGLGLAGLAGLSRRRAK